MASNSHGRHCQPDRMYWESSSWCHDGGGVGREGAYWWGGIRTDRSGEDDLAGRDTRWLPGPGVILGLKIL